MNNSLISKLATISKGSVLADVVHLRSHRIGSVHHLVNVDGTRIKGSGDGHGVLR